MQMAVEIQRDPRTMNHMDAETKVVHARLEAWGKWARDAGLRAWPAETLLARVMEQGPMGAGQQGRPPISMPDEIATIDAAVTRLGDIDRRVVQTYYLRWEPLEIMARRHSLRARQFQNVLRRARWRIAIRLSEVEKI